MSLNKELLKILACPKCKNDIELVGNEEGLKCTKCSLVYPIKEEIPVMLIDEAISLEDWDKGAREKK
ncbi:MAG: Trm112 family protein [Desulfonatronovibrio sp.]